jgi:hypothetical protein
VLWQQEPDLAETARDLVPDATGDVFVTGEGLFKLSGTDGTEIWRRPSGRRNVLLAPDGNVVVAGADVSGADVSKISAVDGGDIWSVGLAESVVGLAVDSAGNVVAGEQSGTVTKLSPVGAILWQVAPTGGTIVSLATDAAGNVVGITSSLVFKLAAADGMVLWSTFGGTNRAVGVDGAGGVVTVGGPSGSFRVRKLSGVDGSEQWSFSVPDTGCCDSIGLSVAIDPNGDVVAGGGVFQTVGTQHVNFTVVKLHGGSGAELWRREVRGFSRVSVGAYEVAITASGDVVAAGALTGLAFQAIFTVAKMTGPLIGTKLALRDRDGDAAMRKLIVGMEDPSFTPAPPGSVGDPTISGARLEIANPGSGESGSIPLPASNWEAVVKSGGEGGYRYRDSARVDGPCRTVTLNNGKGLKLNCKGAGIPFALDDPAGQGSLAILVTTGDDTLGHCALFGGEVKADVPATAGGAGLFKARRASPPSSCADLGLGSPSGAFINPTANLID